MTSRWVLLACLLYVLSTAIFMVSLLDRIDQLERGVLMSLEHLDQLQDHVLFLFEDLYGEGIQEEARIEKEAL